MTAVPAGVPAGAVTGAAAFAARTGAALVDEPAAGQRSAPGRGAAPSWVGGFLAVYVAALARARVARVPLLFVAAFQSLGILLLLRGVVDTSSTTSVVTRESVVAGCTVLVVAFVALNLLAQRFGALRASGAVDFFVALPVPPTAVVLATAASFATFALPGAVVTAIVGALLYGLPLGHLWLLAPVLLLAGAGLAGVGALLGLLAPKPELATLAGQAGMSAVLFLGIIPPDRLPLGVRLLRALLPSSYQVDALRAAFGRTLDVGLVARQLGISAGIAVVTLLLAAQAMRRAVRR